MLSFRYIRICQQNMSCGRHDVYPCTRKYGPSRQISFTPLQPKRTEANRQILKKRKKKPQELVH